MSSRANVKTGCLVGVFALHFRTFVLIMVEASTHSAGTFAFRGTVLMCLYSLRFLAINDFRVCCPRQLEMQTQLDFFQILIEISESDRNESEVDNRLQWQSGTALKLRFQEPNGPIGLVRCGELVSLL